MKENKTTDKGNHQKIKTVICIVLAAAIWIPAAPHVLAAAGVTPSLDPSRMAASMSRRYLTLWREGGYSKAAREQQLAPLRRQNPEWDFMSRTYTVLALANLARQSPSRETHYVDAIDRIIDDTLQSEKSRGMHYFLMAYAKRAPFKHQPGRSLFIDGEIALMLGARRLVKDSPEFKEQMKARVETIYNQMKDSPLLSAESYPDECWMFCNAIAIAALHLSDHLDKTLYEPFIRSWLKMVKTRLIDKKSGLLVSSYKLDGTPLDGPEGSSLWMVLHCLKLVDRGFAAAQYALAKKALIRNVMGYGYAREWPESREGASDVQEDIDSGPIVPGFGASPGASGLAILGAATFNDTETLNALLRSLIAFGLPNEKDGELRFDASNLVGDAVILYALTQGRLFKDVGKGIER